MIKKLLILSVSLFILISKGQEISVKAVLSKHTVSTDDRVSLLLEVSGSGNFNIENIEVPKLDNSFRAFGPMQSTSTRNINGVSTKKQSLNYYLQFTKEGDFKIPPFKVVIKGKEYITEVLDLSVIKGKAPLNQEKTKAIKKTQTRGKPFILIELSKNNIFINEPLVATYRLYFKNKLISRPQMRELPQFQDIWSHSLNVENSEIEIEEINQERYYSLLLHKSILVPQKSGKLPLDPIELDVSWLMPTGEIDFFGRPLEKQMDNRISSGNNSFINVKELPANAPKGFSGAVGSYNLMVKNPTDLVRSGEDFQVDVVVSGEGNLNLMNMPEFPALSSTEVYDPKRKDNIIYSSSGISGKVTEQYVVIPNQSGKLTLPEFSFTYFDPYKQKYITQTKQLDEVRVVNNENKVEETQEVVNNQEKTGADKENGKNQINYKGWLDEISVKKLLLLVGLLLALIALTLVITKNPFKGLFKKKEKKKDYLKAAKQAIKQKKFEETGQLIEEGVQTYFCEKLNIKKADFSQSKVESIAKSMGWEQAYLEKINKFYNELNMLRYAPINNDSKAEQIVQIAEEIIKK